MTFYRKEFSTINPDHEPLSSTSDVFPPRGVDVSESYIREVNSFLKIDNSGYELGGTFDSVWRKISAFEDNNRILEKHSVEAAWIAQSFGRLYGFSRSQLDVLGSSALLHDLGQIELPFLVNKKTPFTRGEKRTANRHPQFSYDFLSGMQFPDILCDVALCHHMSFQEYESLQSGTRLFVELVSVADTYAAVRDVNRKHHATLSNFEARDTILDLMRPNERYNPAHKDVLLNFCQKIDKLEEEFGLSSLRALSVIDVGS